MNTLAERLKYARERLKLSQQEVADKVGMAQPSYFKIEKGKTKRTTYINQLANTLQVNVDWLLTGEGKMSILPLEITDDINNIEKINPKQLRKVPIINWVQAGVFTEIASDSFDEYEYVIDSDYGKNVYWLRVKGDSMIPTFNQGDLILVDMDRQPIAGNYVIALLDEQEQATFKRYKPSYDEKTGKQYFQLIALNEFYSPIDSRVQQFHIIGTVIEHKRSLV